MRVMSKHKTTGKLLWRQFFGNKISESKLYVRNFQKYLSPKISRHTVAACQNMFPSGSVQSNNQYITM